MNANIINATGIAKAKAFSKALLSEYDYDWTDAGLDQIYDVWSEQKENLIEMLSRHPNWDSENFRIVFDANIRRERDQSQVEEFVKWASSNAKRIILERGSVYFRGMTAKEFNSAFDRVSQRQSSLFDLIRLSRRPDVYLSDAFLEATDEYNRFHNFARQ